MSDDHIPWYFEPDTPLDNKIKVTLGLVINYIKNERESEGSGAGYLLVLKDDFKEDPNLLRLVKKYAEELRHYIETKGMDPYQLLMVYGDAEGESLLLDVANFIDGIGKPPPPKPKPVRGRPPGAKNKPKAPEL